MPRNRLEQTTLRDFGGGWNVADSDLNLSSRYQPLSDNTVRGVDGSFYPRWGMALHANFKDGTEVTYAAQSVTAGTTNTQPYVNFNWTSHPFTSGEHVTITGASAINGIPAADINRTHGVLVVDADNFRVPVRTAATSTGTSADTPDFVRDTHTLNGNIIHDNYFNRRLVVFTDIGEVGTVDQDGNVARIWDYEKADTLSSGLIPTRACGHWSSDSFKSTLIACNGYDKDKPLQIDEDFGVEFLVDKATSSNAAVPRSDFVVCLQTYVVFIRTEYGDPFIELSAAGTDGTFTREASPADAAEIDLSLRTSTVEPTVLGAKPIRDKLYCAFYDKGMVGELGIYNSSGDHVPDFNDTIAEHGAISHHTMVSLGNDILMCDYAGVPSVSLSAQSGTYVPIRLSELIGPAIQRHLANLSEDTLRERAFALFSKYDRSYMLFVPKCDEVSQSLQVDPFIFNDDLRELNYAIVVAPNHKLFDRSYVTIAGASAIGTLTTGNINGVRRVVSIINDDMFVVELGDAPSSSLDVAGGGNSVSITPVDDETIVYVFEYNREFKLRRWTRFRGWNFRCGCVSQRGKVFLCKGMKVYRMGNYEEPVYADFFGDYDYSSWSTSTNYVTGDRVLDSDGFVYIAQEDHESASSGTFAEARAADPDLWDNYYGEPINWVLETPWSDLQQRGSQKINKAINLDAEGIAAFTVSCFVNQIYRSPTTNELTPIRSMQFHAGDVGGWGVQNSGNWGGGRRTREEKLWPFEVRGKLFKWRYEGSTTSKVRIISHTMYFRQGNVR